MSHPRLTSLLATVAGSMLLISCATQQVGGTGGSTRTPAPLTPPPTVATSGGDDEALVLSQEVQREPEFFVKEGSGVFLKQQGAVSNKQPAKGDITLNFEGVELREVLKVIFEEILRENYLIDEKVQGVVTIHTTYPVSTESVLPILETILQRRGRACRSSR
ncbi:MAG: hypothetical protein P8Z77_15710 [Candidatus Thiodiazotropha sp.]